MPTRLIVVAMAAGSLMAMPLAAPATAAAGASCSKLASPPAKVVKKVLTNSSTLTGCLPTAATGGSGTSVTQIGIKVKGKTVSVSKTTWAKGKGTTTATVTCAKNAATLEPGTKYVF